MFESNKVIIINIEEVNLKRNWGGVWVLYKIEEDWRDRLEFIERRKLSFANGFA